MPRPELRALEQALIAADVAPRFVARTIQELSEHLDDIEADALASGLAPATARAFARAAIGTDQAIRDAVTARRELLCWHARWPVIARTLAVGAYYVLLPAAPFVYCVHHGGTIARWGASASLGALVTGALLFSMQLALH